MEQSVTPKPPTTPVSGFTLVELLIVTAVLAIIAGIAVPFILSSRISANEAAAISTLKTIGTAQTQARSSNSIDSDSNGVGEYGFLQELSGVRNTRVDTNGNGVAGREGTSRISPPFLSPAFGQLDANGRYRRSGYVFQVYLPGRNLQWQAERATNRSYRNISTAHAENYWAIYAWPQSLGGTGKRAFFMNQVGQILSSPNSGSGRRRRNRYSGDNGPNSDAVIVRGSRNRRMDGEIAVNAEGRDRSVWRVVR